MVWLEENVPIMINEKEIETESAESNFVDDGEKPNTSNPNLNISK